MSNNWWIFAAVAGVIGVFAMIISQDMEERENRIGDFKSLEIKGIVEEVDFQGKYSRVYVKGGLVFDFVIDVNGEGMDAYNNVHLNQIIHEKDSIFKNSNEFRILVLPNSGEEAFVLFGRGELRK